MSRIVIVTQARTTSTRLPRKVLQRIQGRTLLEWHIERLKLCALAAEIVVATTVNATDDELIPIAEKMSARWFRGSENDVLSRYWGAARDARAEMVVRVTSDCPLWDPIEGAKVANFLAQNPRFDLVNNCEPRTYPRGLDTEAFWMDVLERMQRMAPPAPTPEREHVTEMAYSSAPHLFIKQSISDSENNSRFRWCVDTRDDFAMIEALVNCIGNPMAGYRELLSCAKAHPEINQLNAHVEQKKV